ncbi:MAG: GAF domain-containing protein, partial [Solirubrobacteraceae bacterium]
TDYVVHLALTRAGRAEALDVATGLVLPPDSFFDAICARASEGTGADASYVSFVFADCQFIKGADALPDGFDHTTEVGLEDSICRLVVGAQAPYEVPDTTKDRHLRSCGPVQSGLAAAYLGVPVLFGGQCLGALAAVTAKARDWTDEDRRVLLGLAERLSAELASRNSERTPVGLARGVV